MACHRFLGGFVCTRKRREKKVPCFSQANGCDQGATVQCDGPAAEGKTCDRNCCPKHAKRVGPDKDLCLECWVKAGRPASVA